jgi:hypothetical protein
MPLTANFLADFSSFITACKDATTSTEQLVESAGKVGADVDEAIGKAAGSIKSMATGVADFAKSTYSVLSSSQVKDFVGDVTTAVMGFVNEFAEGEAATARLTVALKNAGQASPDVIAAYGEMATHLQSVSRFSDEALTDTQTYFTTIGQVGPENMQQVLEATMDLAIGIGKDLPDAAKLMVQAAQSDGEALGKLKKIFGDTIPEGASFAEVLEAINKKFGGQAAADMETTTGKLANMKNQMSDFNEQIGAVLADNLKSMLDAFKALPEGMQTFIIATVAIGTAITPLLVSGASVITMLGTMGVVGGATSIALGPVALVIAGIGAALLAIWAVWHYWDDIVAVVKQAVGAIVGFLKELPAAFAAVIVAVAKWYADLYVWLWEKLSWLIGQVIKLPAKIVDAFKWMYNEIIGMSSVPDLVDGIAEHFGRLDGTMVDPALAAVGDVAAGFASLNGPIPLGTLTPGASAAAGGAGGAPVTVNVNMSGMLGTDDPQTRATIADLVSDAVMAGMRNTRRLGTV